MSGDRRFCRVVRPDSSDFWLNAVNGINFKQLINRAEDVFGVKCPITALNLKDVFCQLRQNALKILELNDHPYIKKKRKVLLPCLLPPIPYSDMGTCLSRIFFPAVEKGHRIACKRRIFLNRCGSLNEIVTAFPGTGHDIFFSTALEASGWRIYLYIADCMRRKSVTEQRQLSPELIEAGFSVTGGCDGLCALALYSNILADDWVRPGIDYSGIQVGSNQGFLYAKTGSNNLILSVAKGIAVGSTSSSSALSFCPRS